MKSIKEFKNQKLPLNSLKNILGGECSCTLITETSSITGKDEQRETYNDNGMFISSAIWFNV
jgi:hypothetical protein